MSESDQEIERAIKIIDLAIGICNIQNYERERLRIAKQSRAILIAATISSWAIALFCLVEAISHDLACF